MIKITLKDGPCAGEEIEIPEAIFDHGFVEIRKFKPMDDLTHDLAFGQYPADPYLVEKKFLYKRVYYYHVNNGVRTDWYEWVYVEI